MVLKLCSRDSNISHCLATVSLTQPAARSVTSHSHLGSPAKTMPRRTRSHEYHIFYIPCSILLEQIHSPEHIPLLLRQIYGLCHLPASHSMPYVHALRGCFLYFPNPAMQLISPRLSKILQNLNPNSTPNNHGSAAGADRREEMHDLLSLFNLQPCHATRDKRTTGSD